MDSILHLKSCFNNKKKANINLQNLVHELSRKQELSEKARIESDKKAAEVFQRMIQTEKEMYANIIETHYDKIYRIKLFRSQCELNTSIFSSEDYANMEYWINVSKGMSFLIYTEKIFPIEESSILIEMVTKQRTNVQFASDSHSFAEKTKIFSEFVQQMKKKDKTPRCSYTFKRAIGFCEKAIKWVMCSNSSFVEFASENLEKRFDCNKPDDDENRVFLINQEMFTYRSELKDAPYFDLCESYVKDYIKFMAREQDYIRFYDK